MTVINFILCFLWKNIPQCHKSALIKYNKNSANFRQHGRTMETIQKLSVNITILMKVIYLNMCNDSALNYFMQTYNETNWQLDTVTSNEARMCYCSS